jgi:GNAT superfamily N-acetyltransferase
MSVLELFCDVDDFMLRFVPQWKATQLKAGKQREHAGQLCPSEVMTILIHFHQSHYRTFKAYYTKHVQVHLTSEFPSLVSYTRFVALIPGIMVPMLAYLQSRFGACTGISFIDSTSLEVCDPKRISQHRVFAVDARRGKTIMGWFFGFKLHLAGNSQGELLACCLTPGNVDDRTPVPALAKRLRGKLFGDRGYISAPLIYSMMVDAGYQGKGYATAALRLILERLRQLPHCTKVSLEYDRANERAARLYRRFGFQEVAQSPTGGVLAQLQYDGTEGHLRVTTLTV